MESECKENPRHPVGTSVGGVEGSRGAHWGADRHRMQDRRQVGVEAGRVQGGGEWVERILERRRASAIGLLQWTVIRVWLSIIWIRGSGAGVWQVSVVVVSVLGLVGLTKLGSESGTERRKEIKEPLDSETWKKERMALVKDCVLFW